MIHTITLSTIVTELIHIKKTRKSILEVVLVYSIEKRSWQTV